MQLEKMQISYMNNILTNLSYDSYICYGHHLKIILNYFYDLNILTDSKITYELICSFIQEQRKKGVANKTINKRIGVFKRMIIFNDSSSISIFKKVKKLKEIDTTFNVLTLSDCHKLIDYINTSSLITKNKAILSLFLDSGIRLNELVNIKRKNVDFKENSILLETTKTNINRYIFFTSRTLEFLKIVYEFNKNTYLFDTTKSAVRSIFVRVKEQLNFPKFHPHMLRHTYATLLVNSNVNLEFIRVTMGHTNLNTTKRYLHSNPEQLSNLYHESFPLN